jgi:hypothetical protein
VRQADDAGNWPEAQRQAVGKQPGYSTDAFEAFDTQVKAALELQRSQTVQGLEAAGRWLPWLGAVSVLVGLLAAAGAWTGFAQRWEEYR